MRASAPSTALRATDIPLGVRRRSAPARPRLTNQANRPSPKRDEPR